MHLWTYNAVSNIIYLIYHSFAFVLKIRVNMHLYFVQQDGSSGLGHGLGPHQWSLSDGSGSTVSIWMSLQGWGFSHSCNDWSPTAFRSGLGTVLIPVSYWPSLLHLLWSSIWLQGKERTKVWPVMRTRVSWSCGPEVLPGTWWAQGTGTRYSSLGLRLAFPCPSQAGSSGPTRSLCKWPPTPSRILSSHSWGSRSLQSFDSQRPDSVCSPCSGVGLELGAQLALKGRWCQWNRLPCSNLALIKCLLWGLLSVGTPTPTPFVPSPRSYLDNRAFVLPEGNVTVQKDLDHQDVLKGGVCEDPSEFMGPNVGIPTNRAGFLIKTWGRALPDIILFVSCFFLKPRQ